MSDFVHLHLHSEYSLLDGACRIQDIPARAAECGHTAVAITDHGVMYGAVAFYQACREAGIKPIIGCEVYVASGSRYDKMHSSSNVSHHLVLLCENEIGYRNLIGMVSQSFVEGFYAKPRVDMELLRRHSEGLIALSGCLAGKIPRLLSAGDYAGAKAAAVELSEVFGEGNFYIELQNHGMVEQIQILPELVRLAEDCHLPMVATNDCHYLRRKDADTQAVLMCIQTNSVISDGRPIGFETDEFYYKDSGEMKMLFGKYDGAIENTVKIAERCHFDFDFDHIYLPTYPCPDGMSPTAYLRALTYAGLSDKEEKGAVSFDRIARHTYEERIEYELSVIDSMGYSEYFLIVQDYVNYAKGKGIAVGPGRGSGAGSLVAYLVGITDIDSLRFDLLFERFLNPERVSMPDIDIDFCYTRRDEVIAYVAEKYGSDHVSQIITFGTLAAKAAVRDVGRALGMPYSDVDVVAKAIPHELGISLSRALKTRELKELYESSEQIQTLIDTALAIEGMPRNISVHAAGVVITDRPISSYVPLAVSNDTVVTQYDMDTIARLGLLKFDFLALRYLTILQDAENQIRESHPDFRLEAVPLDDADTYALISQGNTAGVFQLESAGMRQMLSQLKPEGLEDILAAIALYRPGPMDSIPRYIECRHDPSKISYDIPELEPILRNTYGCVVYQEQVMSIFQKIGGFTLGHADIVRRAMSKKKAAALEAERQGFIEGARARNVSPQAAEALFEDMSSFANYAFNKSHAAAYAVISYRTAYLKTHYPREYFAALLTSVLGNATKVAEYIVECEKHAIRVLPPDVNHSRMYFHVSGQDIRFGLLALKNAGKPFVASIIRERERRPFASFEDFVGRMAEYDLNKRQVEALIKSGAFDSLGVYRSRLLHSYETVIDATTSKNRSNVSGQLDMFSSAMGAVSEPAFSYPPIPELTLREKLTMERECSGMYFSGHPVDDYGNHIADLHTVPLSAFVAETEEGALSDGKGGYLTDRRRVKVAGVVSSITRKTMKNGDQMAFFTLEDRAGEVECILFAKQYPLLSPYLYVDSPLCVEGSVSVREEEAPKVLVSTILELSDNRRYQPQPQSPKPINQTPRREAAKPTRLFLRLPDRTGTQFRKVENLIGIFDGAFPVILYDSSCSAYFKHPKGLALSDFILGELRELLGDENVILK